MKLKRPLRGSESGADVRMVQRALNKWAAGRHVDIPLTAKYDRTTQDRVMAFQAEQKIKPASGDFGQRTLDALWPYFDAYGRMRYRLYRPPEQIPDLGPVFIGGKSVLDHDLTHATSGIPLYPAFDDAFGAGREIVAYDDGEIWKKDSSAHPGEAVYFKGDQKVDAWMGHIDRDYPLGTRFKRGQFIGKTVPTDIGGGPHVHVGLNVERLLGAGKELVHHTDYTHGAPTVREQLERALV